MKPGDVVIVKVNGGVPTRAHIVEIHGDIVRVAGMPELEEARVHGREPLGVGFPISQITVDKKANSA